VERDSVVVAVEVAAAAAAVTAEVVLLLLLLLLLATAGSTNKTLEDSTSEWAFLFACLYRARFRQSRASTASSIAYTSRSAVTKNCVAAASRNSRFTVSVIAARASGM